MPSTQQAKSNSSTSNKPAAKYTNKDGSKFIKVPTTISTDTPVAMAQTSTNGQAPLAPSDTNGATPVNRKKQKRREKQAAKLAAGQPGNSSGQMGHGETNGFDTGEQGYDTDQDGGFSESNGQSASPPNGYANPSSSNPGKKSKKKKNKGGSQAEANGGSHMGNSHSTRLVPPLPLQANLPPGPGISREKIWNTSSNEERERIKQYWLSLGEEERKSLVKVEKDAVLRKMKEQQRHSCSCSVCGRKRTAIEEELEVLYDAYYEELEQFAHLHDRDPRPSLALPHRRFGQMSGLQPPNRLPSQPLPQASRGRIVNEPPGDEEEDDGEEEYSEDELDEDDDDYSEDEPEDLPRSHATDFFNFGQSLTVQGGILTVADDLLKNDGKKFIEMMEQLAERRMAREEDAEKQQTYQNYHPPSGLHPHSHPHSHSHSHNHAPLPDEEEYDEEEEDDEEYDSQDDDYDEDESDALTEEQRMEEGRRMFQIFAARMFEQRVLNAYREKLAQERQQELLQELEQEGLAESQKKAKKAKDAQKKKDKIAQKKQALAEEKAKKEAEKAAQESALRAAEEKRAEEQRLKAEEKRRKKEAHKKAEEEERAKKEADKQRRLQEQRERQAELERKQREAKEKERKEKEELRQREREAKEAKEREAKDRKEKMEREKREKEESAKAEKETKEQQRREELMAQQAEAKAAIAAIAASQAAKRPPVPIPASFQPQPTAIASPLIQIATPAVPKAPTPIKLRTASQQDSASSSSVPRTPQTGGISQNVSPVPSTPLQGSPGPVGPPGKQPPYLHHPQASSPIHSALKAPPGMQPGPFPGMQPLSMPYPPPGMPMIPPGYAGRMHDPMFAHQQSIGGQYRPMAGPPGMPIHSGMHPGNIHQIPQGRGFPMQHPPPGFPQSPSGGAIGQPSGQTHSRHQSASYESPVSAPLAQPIARPVPIGRPSSIVHGRDSLSRDIDDLSNHLGSSALLDGCDEAIPAARRIPPGHNFPPPPFNVDSAFASPITPYGNNTWGPPFGSSSLPSSNFVGGWPPASSSFGNPGGPTRQIQPRPVSIRLTICQVCKNLEGSTPDGYFDVNAVKDQVNLLFPPTETAVSEKELLDICETEGSANNGSGSFDIRTDGTGRHSIRYELDLPSRPFGAGEIGSPIVGGGGARFGPPGLTGF